MESYRERRLKGYQKNGLKKDCGSIRIGGGGEALVW